MTRFVLTFLISLIFHSDLTAETVRFSTTDNDYQITNVFSNVNLFTIEVDIDMPLTPGLYLDPTIISVSYRVFGSLEFGTPSGFPSFDLVRNISGTEFYAQGGSLMFEIVADADFSDGIQADELVDNGNIFTLNAREVGNGRFHPAILELYADGTGRIQNSNNVHTVDPLLEVNFGDEYITDLIFDVAATTLFTVVEEEVVPDQRSSGSGTISWPMLISFFIIFLFSRNSITKKIRQSL